MLASLIRVRALTKHYQVHERPAGLAASMRSLFRRTYKTVKAVDGIDFRIDAGERVGFLGPNGAGKTTTLKVLAGLLHPTAGDVRVDDHEPRRRDEAFLRKITLVLGQKQQLLWDLPPSDTFELNRAIYGVDRRAFDETLEEIVSLLEIGDVMRRPTRQLSLGERMKCELAAALIHRPKLLFLDEPTIGLDVGMQATVRDFIRRYNERHGATIILTSHNMADVASLCPRVILIDHGKLAYDGSLEGLVKKSRPEKRVVLRLAEKTPADALATLGAIVSHEDARAVLTVPQGEVSRVVAHALATLRVVDLEVTDPPLEEVMAGVFGGDVERGSSLASGSTALRDAARVARGETGRSDLGAAPAASAEGAGAGVAGTAATGAGERPDLATEERGAGTPPSGPGRP